MRSHSVLIAVGILTTAQIALAQKPGPDVIAAADGDLTVVPITHASVSIRHGSDVILIDPGAVCPRTAASTKTNRRGSCTVQARTPCRPTRWRAGARNPGLSLFRAIGSAGSFRALPAPTLILVTDIHTNPLDPRAIAALKSPFTRLVVPVAARSRMLDIQAAEPMANGEKKAIGDLTIEAIAMYNLQAGSYVRYNPSCEGPRQWLHSHGWGQTTLRGRRYVMHT